MSIFAFSTLPDASFGESVVCRARWFRSIVNLDLEMLGMPDYVHNYILEIINRSEWGNFYCHRPRPGSGKNDDALFLLAKINTIRFKLLTAEEPVELRLGRNRLQVRGG